MSKNLPKPQASEEVDLGQVFKLIGNTFDRFFNFIKSIFTGLFKLILTFFIHLYKRKIWYIITVGFGLVTGFILDSKSDTLYGANIFIETNFNSARQVYENMKQLHQLANKDKDSVKLSEILGVTPFKASKLKGFYIEPDIDENDIAEMYFEYNEKLDSISKSEITFMQYKESLTPYNYKIHRIGVAATDKKLYKQIENLFVKQLANNNYLHELLTVNKENLERENQALISQIQKTDSLVDEYLKIRINESNKEQIPGGGTNLYMGDADSSNLIVDESQVIENRLILEESRREVFKELVEQKNVINVIAGFPETGYDISNWKNKKKFTFPLILFILTLAVFTILGFSKYLDSEIKKE